MGHTDNLSNTYSNMTYQESAPKAVPTRTKAELKKLKKHLRMIVTRIFSERTKAPGLAIGHTAKCFPAINVIFLRTRRWISVNWGCSTSTTAPLLYNVNGCVNDRISIGCVNRNNLQGKVYGHNAIGLQSEWRAPDLLSGVP